MKSPFARREVSSGAFLIIGVLGLLSAGCRTKCSAEDMKSDPARLAKEQTAAGRAQPICRDLQYPKVALASDRLTVTVEDEKVVAARGDLPAASSARFEPLAARLAHYRSHFKLVWPADTFDGKVSIALDPDVEAARAIAVMRSSALAGYRNMNVHLAGPVRGAAAKGASIFDGEWFVRTPAEDAERAGRPLTVVRVAPSASDGGYVARVHGVDGCRRVRVEARADGPSDIAKAIGGVCEGASPCTDVLEIEVPTTVRASLLLAMIDFARNAPALASQRVRLSLVVSGDSPDVSAAAGIPLCTR